MINLPGDSHARRQSSGETRRQVLSRAVEIINETGLGASLDHINLEALIRDVGAPRTTVYRLWPTKEDFLTDMLVELVDPARHGLSSYDPTSLEKVEKMLAAAIEEHPGQQLGPIVGDAIRVGVEDSFHSMASSIQWQTYMAATLTLDSLPEQRRDAVESALKAMQATFIETMSGYYGHMLDLLGLRLRPGLTTEHLAVVASTLLEGLVQRRRLTPDLIDTPIVLDGDEDTEPWHLAAVAFMGILNQFLEDGWQERRIGSDR